MLNIIKSLTIAIVLMPFFNCKNNKIIDKNFSYIIIFSDTTEYFFKINHTPFIQEETLFINEKDIELIKGKLNNVQKILLTHKSSNEIFNVNKIKNKTFYLSEVKFSLRKAIDFILNDPSIDLKTSLIMTDNTLNKEDLEYLEQSTRAQNINITVINETNIPYLKNLIVPKITRVILFSIKNNHVFLKKLSGSPFFKKIDFILIGNTKKNLKEINAKYIIGIDELNLIEMTKKINKNFQYEFNIYKKQNKFDNKSIYIQVN
ncbi:hypothetical protein baBA2_000183 [Borrelia anserina]|uniref:Uncharacterized protein n=2 Tax=Borrelia anserina TaxID=143 RepID=W5SND9_BORAN|nr:hypothetical protein [Borrelia anserina]AHH08153.1 Hypothetical protein BAN_0096200 [Borrelia anserina BA2]AHH08840.1 Hypothetical protein BAN_0096201 [Borrelia anserina BA2]APR64687.1 hypothetical protein N187_00910 [Borrelia anserina Es]UPA06601.1 hypothetical protein baBA2_000183 [Borrelia anserina]